METLADISMKLQYSSGNWPDSEPVILKENAMMFFEGVLSLWVVGASEHTDSTVVIANPSCCAFETKTLDKF